MDTRLSSGIITMRGILILGRYDKIDVLNVDVVSVRMGTVTASTAGCCAVIEIERTITTAASRLASTITGKITVRVRSHGGLRDSRVVDDVRAVQCR